MRSASRVIVIGSGPAAFTSAIYLARANLAPIVFEGEPLFEMIPGGQLMMTTDVENFPGFPEPVGGQELMARMREQALRYGSEIRSELIESVDFKNGLRVFSSTGVTHTADAVVVATGARANWLGLENETRLKNAGVSACAICDGALPVFRGQRLVTVGGGDSAVEEALHLTKFASEVVMVHRSERFRASPVMAERALAHPKIRIEWNTEIEDVLGAEFVEGVRMRRKDGTRHDLACAGLFVAIGHTPNTEFLGGALDTDAKGYIVPAEPGRTRTSIPGVFAAGDVADSYYKQAVTAAASGCQAAIEVSRYLDH